MQCDTESLADSAKCFECLSPQLSEAVYAYLLCQWAGGVIPPSGGDERITEATEVRLTEAGEIRIIQ